MQAYRFCKKCLTSDLFVSFQWISVFNSERLKTHKLIALNITIIHTTVKTEMWVIIKEVVYYGLPFFYDDVEPH